MCSIKSARCWTKFIIIVKWYEILDRYCLLPLPPTPLLPLILHIQIFIVYLLLIVFAFQIFIPFMFLWNLMFFFVFFLASRLLEQKHWQKIGLGLSWNCFSKFVFSEYNWSYWIYSIQSTVRELFIIINTEVQLAHSCGCWSINTTIHC